MYTLCIEKVYLKKIVWILIQCFYLRLKDRLVKKKQKKPKKHKIVNVAQLH